jgi:hypothetical protein
MRLEPELERVADEQHRLVDQGTRVTFVLAVEDFPVSHRMSVLSGRQAHLPCCPNTT